MKRRLHALTVALVAFAGAVAPACSKSTPPPPRMVTTHRCTVMIRALPPAGVGPVRGHGSGATEAVAEEAAWTDACRQLPEADRAACRNSPRWTAGTTRGSMTVNGATTQSATIELRPNAGPESRGQGTSTASVDAACTDARAAACQAAGATGDCVAAHTHEAVGRTSTSELGVAH